MEALRINYDKSKYYFGLSQNEIASQECYANCFRLLYWNEDLFRDFEEGKIKVAYCYMSSLVFVRHCVLLHDEHGIIDATRFFNEYANEETIRETEYLIFDTLECEEYYTMIKESNGSVDYKEAPNEINFIKEFQMKYQFYSINEYDLIEYIIPKISKIEGDN